SAASDGERSSESSAHTRVSSPSARLVLALADGELAEGETLRHSSPYGSAFEARLDRASGWSILLRGRVDLSR
ncbi:hypothetical protein AB0K48_31525, partial [Nonomuraea sp. NPDC055795]